MPMVVVLINGDCCDKLVGCELRVCNACRVRFGASGAVADDGSKLLLMDFIVRFSRRKLISIKGSRVKLAIGTSFL